MIFFQDKTRRRMVNFDGFSIEKEGKGKLFAHHAYGCDCRKGILRRGVGVELCYQEDGSPFLIAMQNDIAQVFFIRYYNDTSDTLLDRMMVQANGILYAVDEGTGRTYFRCELGEPLVCHSVKTDKPSMLHLVAGSVRMTYTVNGAAYTSVMTGSLRGACVVDGRAFIGLDGRTIQYTTPYSFSSFSGSSNDGGTLYLPDGDGEILSLQTDGKYLYVFLDREIYRITVSAEGVDFAVEKVEYYGGDICTNSMATTTKGIVFLSLGGVHLLRGKKAVKICRRLPVYPIDGKYLCRVGYCAELILIDYKTREKDGTEKEKRVAISVEDNDGFFCERYGMLGGNDLCVIGGALYKFVKDSPKAEYQVLPYFEVKNLDFGTSAKKYLKGLRLKGRGQVRVRLQGNGAAYDYSLGLDGGEEGVKLSVSGRRFSLWIYPMSGAEVHSMQIEYRCLEG